MERRKRARKKTRHPAYFVCSDAAGRETLQDMATVLNINENGLLLESAHNLIGAREIRVTAAADDQPAPAVKGDVVYAITVAENKFHTGIAFKDTAENVSAFVAAIITNTF